MLLKLRRHGRAALVLLTLLSMTAAGSIVSSGPAAASVDTDRAQTAKLEHQIAAQGAQEQALVTRYNTLQSRVDALDAQIAHNRKVVAEDQRVGAAATGSLRRVAIKAYMTGTGMDSSALEFLSGTSNINTTLEEQQYLGAVNNKLTNALDVVHVDQDRTLAAQSNLVAQEAQAKAALSTLTSAHDAAASAIRSEQAQLTSVRGNLRTLLAAAAALHAVDERAAEQALAQAIEAPSAPTPAVVHLPHVEFKPATPSTPAKSSAPSPPGPVRSTAGYANPLRGAIALSPERIDQGVDYSSIGPIYAIGDGVVLTTSIPGWPGGTFIAYQLTSGFASGLVVYAAEDIEPSVHAGSIVTSETVLGQMYAGPDGIETGWADPDALGNTMAHTYAQFNGANSTAFGANFSQFLQSLGAPGGILQNDPPTGRLPGGWPSW